MPMSRTIFVADDDPVLLRGLDVALSGRGYEVRTAPDGPALLSMMETQRPDLLLLDIMMPGMSGLEVLRRIRSDNRWAGLPVMMVTAVPESVADLGPDTPDVVAKPFRLQDLLERIERRLGAGQEG